MKKAQGAIECCSCSMCFLLGKKHQTQSSSSVLTAGTQLGQGATEYLVLLAVVLIVALVSVALLGFFPGMASDAQITQSQAYWRGAQPVSIVESGAKYYNADTSEGYLRLRNNGAYSIRITKIWGNGANISQAWNASGYIPFNTILYLAPGEEGTLGDSSYFPGLIFRQIGFAAPSGGTGWGLQALRGADSICQSGGTGTVVIRDFGFEYIEYLDGNQQITKRQAGRQFITKCIG